jgi:hypothetical protein
LSIPFTVEEMQVADKILRWMINGDKQDLGDYPYNKIIKRNLDAEYIVQSRLINFLDDMRMIRNV